MKEHAVALKFLAPLDSETAQFNLLGRFVRPQIRSGRN